VSNSTLTLMRNASVLEVLAPDEVLAVTGSSDTIGCPRCGVARAIFVLRKRDDTWSHLCVLCDRDARNSAAAASSDSRRAKSA